MTRFGSRMQMAVLCNALVAAANLAAADEPHRIDRVTLYPGSATIERVVRVAPGQTAVAFSGLPANFDASTLRMDADPGIRVGEITVRDVARGQALGAREAELEARIQALNDRKAVLDSEAKTAELVRDYLVKIGSGGAVKDHASGTAALDPKALAVVIAALRRDGGQSYATLQKVAVQQRTLNKEIKVLERDRERLRSGAQDARDVVVGLQAERAGNLRLSYVVGNAGWVPTYRAALDSRASAMELERRASVRQNTGEDWSGVQLKLSTGQPRGGAIVDPETWNLRLHLPIALRDQAGSFARSAVMQAPVSVSAKSPGEAAGTAQEVTELQTPYATEFEVPGPVTLPADGRSVTVSLSRITVPVKQRIRIVPRQDTYPTVVAEAERPDGVWLSGLAQLYRDGSYIGATRWDARATERIAFPFGRDDRVQVSVARIKDRSGSSGILSRRTEHQVADAVSITSAHRAPVELLVLEASPVAADDEIKVEAVFEPKPAIVDWRDRKGVVAWELTLAPGKTVKLVSSYTISHPKDAAVIGLH